MEMKRILIPGILILAMALSSCSSAGSGQPAGGQGTSPANSVSEQAAQDSLPGSEPAGGQNGQESAAEAEQNGEEPAAESGQNGEEPAAEPAELDFSGISLDSNEALKAAREEIFEKMRTAEALNEERASEIEHQSMTFGEARMKYAIETIGEAGSEGYPVYITLHGGGGAPKELNDNQWNQMRRYYRYSVTSGIYIAPRGVRDTWNTHFNPESYPLYERLLANLAIHYNIDTNRVYLLGYSAGGDGVYQITPRMADRFAAVDMSAGHPNGVNLANLYNTPIALQCGENDTDYDRNLETAKYDGVLNDLAVRYGRDGQPEGYLHRTFLHQGKEHAVVDNDYNREEQTIISDLKQWLEDGTSETETTNTNAIDFVNTYTRDPIPERIVWDLSVRTEESSLETFYWLRAPRSVTEGVVVVSYDKETNTVHVEQNTANGPVYAMVNDEMLDIFQDIHVTTADGAGSAVTVTPSAEYIQKTIEERWDKNMIFVGEFELPACGE